jgi:hypothetical protein
MKRVNWLLLVGALVCVLACRKDPVPEIYKDAELTGEKVDVSSIAGLSERKFFILNEGGMGSNNASLDFLRMEDGQYVTGAFKKMNPDVGAGLGDVGNDILVIGDEVWIVVNNSGIVEVVSAKDETEIAAIQVPTPRCLATDGQYVYVSSWAGAFASGSYDANGYYNITDYKNPKGCVYRIGLNSKKLDASVEVGFQPEGIAYGDGKIYVANSGGISSQLPPDYAYDNTVSIIDPKEFKVTKTVQVEVNLKSVFADPTGGVYVTSLGNYWSIHSGLYRLEASGEVKHIADYVSVASIYGDRVYWIGAEEEFDWSAPKTWKAYSCRGGKVDPVQLNVSATTPYGLYVISPDALFLSDAGDYFNPGTVSLYHKGALKWTVTAGVCPGHFATW